MTVKYFSHIIFKTEGARRPIFSENMQWCIQIIKIIFKLPLPSTTFRFFYSITNLYNLCIKSFR